ncbi:MAG TPA: UDP-N-acetylmuramoyl-tripeptide--D-alanyl-D-alanine ligase, partial [Flavobacterium sp.]|nr:UDP-N-acetylmuramoyl-tripeptide--D-alanyl-D-alanine ligase [Flavobacterium sp.]
HIVGLLENAPDVRTYFIGKDFYAVKIESQHLAFYETFEGFSKEIGKEAFRNKSILIKGSRGMALERILDFLQ